MLLFDYAGFRDLSEKAGGGLVEIVNGVMEI